MTKKKTCFVVMGFGPKVDFETGRTLNLDATYHNLIKPAIEDAGLECWRADEITHSGNINVPMYQQILTADVVVAGVELAKNSTNASEAASHLAAAIADFVQAQRVRQEVLSICEQWLKSNPVPSEESSAEAKKQYLNSKYWVVASQAEAYLGIGKKKEAEDTYEQAYAFAPEGWMIDSTKEQRAKLEALLTDSPLKYIKGDFE